MLTAGFVLRLVQALKVQAGLLLVDNIFLGESAQQLGHGLEAVFAGVEIRIDTADIRAHTGGVDESVAFAAREVGLQDQLVQNIDAVRRSVVRGLDRFRIHRLDRRLGLFGLRGFGRFGGLCGREEAVQEQKLVTGIAERFRRCRLAHAENISAVFAQLDGKRRVVAVARNDSERIKAAGVQQLHRIDGKRDVGRVFAGNIVKLLFGADGQLPDGLDPAFERVLAPVAVGALDNDTATQRERVQHIGDTGRRCVVGIDHNSDGMQLVHGIPPLLDREKKWCG